jgi:hypothetical protein
MESKPPFTKAADESLKRRPAGDFHDQRVAEIGVSWLFIWQKG